MNWNLRQIVAIFQVFRKARPGRWRVASHSVPERGNGSELSLFPQHLNVVLPAAPPFARDVSARGKSAARQFSSSSPHAEDDGMRLTSANRMIPRSTTRVTKDIQYLAISKLKPYDKNERTHTARQIRQIARSIEHFGFVNPVLVICGSRARRRRPFARTE